MVSHLLLLSCELDFSRNGAPECIRPPRSAESQTVRKSELGLHPRHAWGWMIFIISDKAVILQLVSRSIPPIVQNTPAEMKWGPHSPRLSHRCRVSCLDPKALMQVIACVTLSTSGQGSEPPCYLICGRKLMILAR